MEAARPETIIVTIRPGLHITETCFRVGTRHFELDGLHDLQTRQSSHHPLTRNAGILAGLVALALIFLSRYMHPAGIVATILVLAGLVVVVFLSAQSRPRRLELWARYHGQLIPIFASEDEWIFGAVERQLRRSTAEVHRGKRQVPPNLSAPNVPHPSTLHPSTYNPSMM